MTKFIYKMENILTVKMKLEDHAKTAYGDARMKLNQEEEKLLQLNTKLEMYQDNLKISLSSLLNMLEIKQCTNAIKTTKIYIKQQQAAVKKAEQNLENARKRLNAAMLERKTHEKLKEKAFEEFKIEYEADQRKEIDELVSFKYNNPTGDQEEW